MTMLVSSLLPPCLIPAEEEEVSVVATRGTAQAALKAQLEEHLLKSGALQALAQYDLASLSQALGHNNEDHNPPSHPSPDPSLNPTSRRGRGGCGWGNSAGMVQ